VGASDSSPAQIELSAEERRTRLERVVRARTREARAEVQSQGEFDAVLVRGAPVHHSLHFVGTVGAAALGAALGRLLFGDAGLLAGLVAGAGYALFWLFLAVAGGLEFDNLAVDERGVVTSEITGRPVEARGNFLKVAIPAAVVAYSLFLMLGLSHDLVFPPPPSCNTSPPPPNACLLLPNLADALNGLGQSPSPSPNGSPQPSPSPSGSPQPSPTPRTAGVPLSVDDTIALERVVRGFQLLFSTVALVVAGWFLRRMLTGRWVLLIKPVRGDDEER
jgi:hypothetical protein